MSGVGAMQSLPDELQLAILDLCDLDSLVICKTVCKTWASHLSQNGPWISASNRLNARLCRPLHCITLGDFTIPIGTCDVFSVSTLFFFGANERSCISHFAAVQLEVPV
jgi:hypothetical protein